MAIKHSLKRTFSLGFCLGVLVWGDLSDLYASIRIVPQPSKVTETEGTFDLCEKTRWSLSSDSLRPVADFFKHRIEQSTGWKQSYAKRHHSDQIILQIEPMLGVSDESYLLKVTPAQIEVKGRTLQALFYGMQSLMQLLPADIEGSFGKGGRRWLVPSVTIEDTPAFGYRGMMLDVGRHFHGVEFIKKQLDVMALYKMNRFHWHLTEDHLWTIEIKKYPLLTTIGSRRVNADGSIHEGFYTQEQIREVVKYAADRFITVIPEIELPGHALAALSAYPELSCTGGPFHLRNKWGVEENVYCAGNEETFTFLKNVLEEVIPLFPGAYFHIGGDECPKSRWKECSKCQQRMRLEGLEDEHQLQSYFIHRIEKVLTSNGKKMIGWDEILEGGLAPTATVMSWRGEEGGIAAAKMGHDVIMTPSRWFYLDFGQGAVEVEPITINFTTTLERTYSYNPYPSQIPAPLQKHILGVQGNMWSEYATNPDLTEYMLYPRLLAVAEVGWTPVEQRDYASFVDRLNNQWNRLDAHHINYHIPLPEGPMSDHVCVVDSLEVLFRNSRYLPMVYTLDGTQPTASSLHYTTPLIMRGGERLRIATLLPTGQLSRVREINFQQAVLQSSNPAIRVRPGLLMQRSEGDFYFVRDTVAAIWSTPVVINDLTLKPELALGGAYRYTGYFEVPEDGVYLFSTEMDQLEVDGRVILSNDGKLTRHSRTRTTVALAKGFHSFRLLMINSNIGGFPRCWNNPGFLFGQYGKDFKAPDVYYHSGK